MRTLGVCLLASGISFNALATDISEVVVNYDGTQPIHKYLKNTDRDAAISAIPQLVEKRYDLSKMDQNEHSEKLTLELALFANSRKIKNTELNHILKNTKNTSFPEHINELYQSGIKLKNYNYAPNENEMYTFKTQVSADNVISCILSKPSGEGSITITDFYLNNAAKKSTIQSDGSVFDHETAYFAEQAILKEAIKLCDGNVDFTKGVDTPNTIIAVDFVPETTDNQKKEAYDTMLHYTMPGILNKVNVENFKDILTTKLLQFDGKEFFDKFISHQHFQDLMRKDEKIREIHDKLRQTSGDEYINACGDIIDLLIKKHIILHNNHIISAYLHTLGCIKNILFIPKTLYQMITIEALMRNDVYRDYKFDISDLSYHPTFNKSENSDYTAFSDILSLANKNAIKYANNRGLDSIIFKIVRNMKKSKYLSASLNHIRDYWSLSLRRTGIFPLAFSCKNSYIPLNFYNVISEIVTKENVAPNYTWRVYHGGYQCMIKSNYSSSFSDGLFSGCIHDSSSGCAASLAFKSGVFYDDIQIFDQNSNFYLPSVHTILPMFGLGELHHVRTKVFTNINEYESYEKVPGFQINFDEKSEKIITADNPMIFTQDPDEFKKVKVYQMTDVNMKSSDYVVKNVVDK